MHMSNSVSSRFQNLRPFIGLATREDGRTGGIQVGFTTYGADEETGRQTYQTSYLEGAVRSDHVAQAYAKSQGKDVAPQFVDDCGTDVTYVASVEDNAAFDKKADKPAADTSEPEVAPAA